MRIFQPWKQLGTLPREVWILFLVSLVNRLGTMVLPFLVLYLTRVLHFSPGRAGFCLTLYGLGALVSAPLGGRFSDRYGSLVVIKASLLLSGTTYLFFPLVHSFSGIVVMTLLLALTSESFRPANLAAVSDYTPLDQHRPAFSL